MNVLGTVAPSLTLVKDTLFLPLAYVGEAAVREPTPRRAASTARREGSSDMIGAAERTALSDARGVAVGVKDVAAIKERQSIFSERRGFSSRRGEVRRGARRARCDARVALLA